VGIVLRIRAVSFKGRPIGRELTAQFGESGGTIGRGETSTLVLPDPERFISRTHLSVSFQAGGFVITDNGTKNPAILNGRPLGLGGQARLADGDQITVGDYALEVALAARAPSGPVPVISRSADPVGWPQTEVPARRVPAALPPDPLEGLRGQEPSIDQLFDLKGSAAADLLRPAVPPDRPRAEEGTSGSMSPLEILRAAVTPVPQVGPDYVPEIFTPYAPPAAAPDPALAPASAVPAAPAAPVGMRIQPTGELPASPMGEALLRAFLQGAGIPQVPLKGLTPEMMEAIGKLLREAVQGTLDLLRVRALAKSEMRTDVTQIMPMDNNPLKFSPTVEMALTHLLTLPMPGFMPPLPAMREAYDDLRAHQFGVLAGMRTALDEVLARFAPDEMERRLSDPGVLRSLLPMNRNAKLWDLFVERYEHVAGEARDDFYVAFGRAFTRAYEAQVKKLRTESRPSSA
jgi:FHA domain-containing protein/type VI secretion system protein